MFHCQVQGSQCSKTVVLGLEQLDKLELDLIVITRGGGSFEDLFGFSKAPVLEAIYRTNTPIISAIGHEVDTMLSDLVADIRAPTPSVAGEIISTQQNKELNKIKSDELLKNFKNFINHRISKLAINLAQLVRHIQTPRNILDKYVSHITNQQIKAKLVIQTKLNNILRRYQNYQQRIQNQDPIILLNRGYSLVTDMGGGVITTLDEFKTARDLGQKLVIHVKDAALIIDMKYIKWQVS